MLLDRTTEPGVFFGGMNQFKAGCFVGMQQGTDGNILVVGGNGSGKTSGIVIPTMMTWGGPICATDIKGELTERYQKFIKEAGIVGMAPRPYIVFDPLCRDGPSYDPFWWLLQDGEDHLVNNVKEIAYVIIPDRPDDPQPFWNESERGVLEAALIYFFRQALSFSEAMCKILEGPVSQLCMELAESGDVLVKMILGQMADPKKADPKVVSNVDRGLRNKLMLFAADPYISHAFRGQREGAECFTWDDLDHYNIFLRIPEDRIEQWGAAINLMYSQLIHYLERRPEKYSAEGADNVQTLLLMDEFARFGRLETITSAMATLRSKSVNICLIVQSIAQLDQIYGACGRRIILDNCQYQAILRANDPETQQILCERIGTRLDIRHSASEQMDFYELASGYSRTVSEARDWIVHPHELASLDDVLLLTPQGTCWIEKLRPCSEQEQQLLYLGPHQWTHFEDGMRLPTLDDPINIPDLERSSKMNTNAKMVSISERTANANKRMNAVKYQQRLAERHDRELREKMDRKRCYIIGELVAKYFPEVQSIEPGTDEENVSRFGPLEDFLSVLAADRELVQKLKARADFGKADSCYYGQCVNGHEQEEDVEGGV